MTIDQLSFCCRDSAQDEPNIHMVGNSIKALPNVDVGLCPSLMGTFSMPLVEINMISSVYI